MSTKSQDNRNKTHNSFTVAVSFAASHHSKIFEHSKMAAKATRPNHDLAPAAPETDWCAQEPSGLIDAVPGWLHNTAACFHVRRTKLTEKDAFKALEQVKGQVGAATWLTLCKQTAWPLLPWSALHEHSTCVWSLRSLLSSLLLLLLL